MSRRLRAFWVAWAGPLFIVLYVIGSAYLGFRRHAAFSTDMFDFGYYTHVVWNTAHGSLFANFIPAKSTNFLQDHFALLMGALAPLFWIAPDARTLQAVTVVGLGLSMLPAYLIVRERQPSLAPLVVLALALNPLGHQVASMDFHEIMLSTPVLAFAAYALYKRNDKLLMICLALALLVREDMGAFVACFGLLVIFSRPGQRILGAGAVIAGLIWTVVITQGLIPALGADYIHTNVFWAYQYGDGLGQIFLGLLKNPMTVVDNLVEANAGQTLMRVLLPLGGLPLITAGEQLLWFPSLLLILMSSMNEMKTFTAWHAAPFVGLLWVTAAGVLARFSPRWAKIATGVLLVTAVIGYFTWSMYPGGGQYDASKYQITEHTRIGEQVMAQVPADVGVAAQSKLAVHLAAREHITLFPWMPQNWKVDMIVLDETDTNPYPLTADQLKKFVLEYEAKPTYKIALDQDSYYIFEPDAQQIAPLPQAWVFSDTLKLQNFALSQTDASQAFQSLEAEDTALVSGRKLRVDLYWTSQMTMTANYAVSVRLVTDDGQVLAQDDSWPARGLLSTLQWPLGQEIRDVHYLTIPDQPLPATTHVQVKLYNMDTQAPLGPESGFRITTLK
jgi:uncharacterized membrane protein